MTAKARRAAQGREVARRRRIEARQPLAKKGTAVWRAVKLEKGGRDRVVRRGADDDDDSL
jgi:hypothetical protein